MSSGAEAYAFIPGTAPDLVIARAEGSYLYASDGRALLDMGGGAIVTNIGHGRAEIADAAAEALRRVDYVIPPWATESRLRLVDRLVRDWLPPGFTQCAFTSGGSESVDSAMKLARTHQAARGETDRWKVIGRLPSYHGATLATLAVGGHETRRSGFDPMLTDYPRVPWDDAEALDKVIEQEGPESCAAFLAEPVIGASGACLVPPEGWFESVRAVCDHHGILLIADEVMTSFGRLGTPMGVDHFGVRPDIIVGGKGLGGGYAPIGGIFTTAEVVQPIADAGLGMMFFTFAAHESAVAVADRVLRVMDDEGLVALAAERGRYLRGRLEAVLGDHPHVADIRGVGLMQGIEYVRDRDAGDLWPSEVGFAAAVTGAALDRGVWIYPAGAGVVRDGSMFGPPFNVTEAEIDTAVGVLADAIDAAAAAATR